MTKFDDDLVWPEISTTVVYIDKEGSGGKHYGFWKAVIQSAVKNRKPNSYVARYAQGPTKPKQHKAIIKNINKLKLCSLISSCCFPITIALCKVA